jgi:hypothetical protein
VGLFLGAYDDDEDSRCHGRLAVGAICEECGAINPGNDE